MRTKDRSKYYCVCCEKSYIEEGQLLKEFILSSSSNQQSREKTIQPEVKDTLNPSSSHLVSEKNIISSSNNSTSSPSILSSPSLWNSLLTEVNIRNLSGDQILKNTLKCTLMELDKLNQSCLNSTSTSFDTVSSIQLCLTQIQTLKSILS